MDEGFTSHSGRNYSTCWESLSILVQPTTPNHMGKQRAWIKVWRPTYIWCMASNTPKQWCRWTLITIQLLSSLCFMHCMVIFLPIWLQIHTLTLLMGILRIIYYDRKTWRKFGPCIEYGEEVCRVRDFVYLKLQP